MLLGSPCYATTPGPGPGVYPGNSATASTPSAARATSANASRIVRGDGQVALLVELAAREPGPAARHAAAAHAAARDDHAVRGAVVGAGGAVHEGGAPELGGDHHAPRRPCARPGPCGTRPATARCGANSRVLAGSWFACVSNAPGTFTKMQRVCRPALMTWRRLAHRRCPWCPRDRRRRWPAGPGSRACAAGRSWPRTSPGPSCRWRSRCPSYMARSSASASPRQLRARRSKLARFCATSTGSGSQERPRELGGERDRLRDLRAGNRGRPSAPASRWPWTCRRACPSP